MQVLSKEFTAALRQLFDEFDVDVYYTREHLCKRLGLTRDWLPAISLALLTPGFEDIVMVKARGAKRTSQGRLPGKHFA